MRLCTGPAAGCIGLAKPVTTVLHVFVPDLTQHGDVHTHPGPVSTRSLPVWSCNVGRGPGVWEFSKMGFKQRISVLAIQEVGLKMHELQAFMRFAEAGGYRSFFAEVLEHDKQAWGGVLILVDFRYRSRQVVDFSEWAAQLVTVMVEDCAITCCYQPPNEPRAPLCSFVEESRQMLPLGIPWLCIGDFNDIPSEAPVARSYMSEGFHVEAVLDSEGKYAPTRWGSARAIDFLITNHKPLVSNMCFHEEAISDHRIICFGLHVTPAEKSEVLKWSSCLYKGKPVQVERQVWDAAFLEKWRELSKPSFPEKATQIQPDEAWLRVAACYELALNHASRHENVLQSEVGWENYYGLCKNRTLTPARFQKNSNLDKSSDCFALRKARNTVAKLAEMLKLERAGKTHLMEYAQLQEKVKRAFGHLVGSAQQKVAQAQRLLDDIRCQHKQKRIKQWREKMQLSDSACYAWVHTQAAQPSRGLFCEGLNQAEATDTTCASLQLISRYWQKTWQRPAEDLRRFKEAVESLAAHGLAERPTARWRPLKASDFVSSAKKLQGKAGNTDGWVGSEISSIPTEALSLIADFCNCCERAGLIPAAWRQLRQIHLPKPGKQVRPTDGARDVTTLRPSAIASVWYRLWGSTRLGADDASAWLQSWISPQACGGVKGRDLSAALGPLFRDVRDGRYLVSLDYSFAFDHCSPEAVTWMFERLGIPLGISGMLLSMWSQQLRFVEFERCVSGNTHHVSSSLPQGDPWSMYGLLALLTPPTVETAYKFPYTALRTYVDDRSWTSASPTEALSVQEIWAKWSGLLGLKENDAKSLSSVQERSQNPCSSWLQERGCC